MTYGIGTKYVGEWKDNDCFGKGEFTDPENNIFIGDWINCGSLHHEKPFTLNGETIEP